MNAAVMRMPAADPARLPSAVLAVLVHALLFAVLFFGVRWSARAPEAIVVELWSQVPVAEPAPAIEKTEPPPKVEPEPLPKPIPKAEPAPAPKKPDIAIERDKKAVKKDDLRFDEVARARMQEQLARETQALAQDRVKRETATAPPPSAPVLDSGYASRIQAKIRGNIVIPPGVTGNPEAIFDVVQIPDGDVIEVRLRKSSGFRAYDEAVERAIRKSSPLPTARRDQFQRQLELKFRPQE